MVQESFKTIDWKIILSDIIILLPDGIPNKRYQFDHVLHDEEPDLILLTLGQIIGLTYYTSNQV